MVNVKSAAPNAPAGGEVEIFVAAYEEQCEQARHYENQHLTVIGFMLTAAAAVVALATFDEQLTWRDRSLGASVMVIGVFALLSSIAYYSRTTRHAKRAEELRFRLDALISSPTITELRKTADEKTAHHLRTYFGLQKVRLHQVWMALDCVVILIGALLMFLAW